MSRVTDENDRRVWRAALRTEGRELIERILAAGQEGRPRLLEKIELDALRGLELGVRALSEALERET